VIQRRVTSAALLAVVVMTIGCDQVSKDLARIHLMGGPRLSWLGDSIRFVYAENSGGFLSLGAGLPAGVQMALFSLGTAIIVAACSVAIARHRSLTPSVLGLTLVAAGGLSNLADGIAYDSVEDVLNLGIGALRAGLFNVADVAILCGIALVVLGGTSFGTDRRAA